MTDGFVATIRSLAEVASVYEADVCCPACGQFICAPTIVPGYPQAHCARCAREIEQRRGMGADDER